MPCTVLHHVCSGIVIGSPLPQWKCFCTVWMQCMLLNAQVEFFCKKSNVICVGQTIHLDFTCRLSGIGCIVVAYHIACILSLFTQHWHDLWPPTRAISVHLRSLLAIYYIPQKHLIVKNWYKSSNFSHFLKAKIKRCKEKIYRQMDKQTDKH